MNVGACKGPLRLLDSTPSTPTSERSQSSTFSPLAELSQERTTGSRTIKNVRRSTKLISHRVKA